MTDAEELASWREFAAEYGFKTPAEIKAALSVVMDTGALPDGTTLGSIESFIPEFYRLQERAKGYGIQSFVALLSTDPLTLQDMTHESFIGSHYSVLGLLYAAARRIERDCCSVA